MWVSAAEAISVAKGRIPSTGNKEDTQQDLQNDATLFDSLTACKEIVSFRKMHMAFQEAFTKVPPNLSVYILLMG